jgi:hypothetical protein
VFRWRLGLKNRHYTKLNKVAFFLFDLSCKVVFNGRRHQELLPSEYIWLADRFTSVFADTTAFANNHGFDVCANFITEENLDAELPALYTLVCGGASLAGTMAVNSKGMKMLKVDHFDGTQPPPDVRTIDPYTDPRVFFATIITDNQVPGGYRVRRFPQYDGKDVPVPLIASRDIYYPMDDLAVLEPIFQKPSPYYP